MDRKQSLDEYCCLICKENKRFYTVGECNHNQVCYYCTLKSRMHYHDFKCPMCTKINKEIFVFEYQPGEDLNFLSISKEECYKDQDFDQNGIFYLDIAAKEEVLNLTSYKCPISNCKEPVFETFPNLTYHLKRAHKRFYCEVCIKDGKRFLSESTLYNQENLQNHMNYGEYDDNWVTIAPIHTRCQVILFFYFIFS